MAACKPCTTMSLVTPPHTAATAQTSSRLLLLCHRCKAFGKPCWTCSLGGTCGMHMSTGEKQAAPKGLHEQRVGEREGSGAATHVHVTRSLAGFFKASEKFCVQQPCM